MGKPRYAISFDARARRRSFTLRLPQAVAHFVGRHVHRLGARRWQIEKGGYATSYVPTRDEPVTRSADYHGYGGMIVDRIECVGVGDIVRVHGTLSGEVTADGMDARKLLSIGDAAGILVEPARTNIALWSEGKS